MLVNDYYVISNSRSHLKNKTKEICSRHAQRKSITDNKSEKIFWSKCEFVIIKKSQDTIPKYKSFIQHKDGNKVKVGVLT